MKKIIEVDYASIALSECRVARLNLENDELENEL
jgi:hypothetical protein